MNKDTTDDIRKIGFNHSDLDQNRIQLSLDCVGNSSENAGFGSISLYFRNIFKNVSFLRTSKTILNDSKMS